MQVKQVIGTAAISAVGIGALALPAYAYSDDPSKALDTRREVMLLAHKAIENKSFETWLEIPKILDNETTPRIFRIIDTREEFNKFAESVELLKKGDYVKARELRVDLGLVGGLRRSIARLGAV